MKFTLVVVYCATPLNRNKKGIRTSQTYSTSGTVDEYKQNPISADDRVDFSMSNNAKLFPFFPLYSGRLWYINRLAHRHIHNAVIFHRNFPTQITRKKNWIVFYCAVGWYHYGRRGIRHRPCIVIGAARIWYWFHSLKVFFFFSRLSFYFIFISLLFFLYVYIKLANWIVSSPLV